jgi:ribosomal protein L37AE/L43A
MPKVEDGVPPNLKPYLFYGVDLQWRKGDKEAVAECPFCGKENKFSVDINKGLYQCWACRKGTDKGGGNTRVFIQNLHEVSYAETKTVQYQELCHERTLLFEETPVEWHLAVSIIDGNWLVPAYNAERKMTTCYSRRNKLLPTPKLGHGIFGANLLDDGIDTIFLTEGPWDAMALWEVASRVEPGKRNNVNVLGVPGCGSVGKPFVNWLPLFQDRVVNIMFDNDHDLPKIPSAGYAATKRAVAMLLPVAGEVNYLKWGPDGWSKDYPHNHDVRDEICLR